MAFLGFLMLFSYTVLVRMEDEPNVQECLVIMYILSTAAEKAREVSALEITVLCRRLLKNGCQKIKE